MDTKLILITGAPGTGKSTLASLLEAELEGTVLHSLYQVRRDLGHRRYLAGRNAEVVDKLLERTCASLDQKQSVLVDSAISSSERRQRIYDIGIQYGVDVLVLECICSEKEAKRRMRRRPKSDGLYTEARDPNAYDRFMERFSPQPIQNDLLHNKHLSYARLDTENEFLTVVRVLDQAHPFLSRITKALFPSSQDQRSVYGTGASSYSATTLS